MELRIVIAAEVHLFDGGISAKAGGEGFEGFTAVVEVVALLELIAEFLKRGDDGGFELGDLDDVQGVLVGEDGADFLFAHGEDHRLEVVAGPVEGDPVEVDFAGILFSFLFGEFFEVRAFERFFADAAHVLEEGDGVVVAVEKFDEMEAVGFGDAAVLGAVFLVVGAEILFGGVGEVLGEILEEGFHAEVCFALVAELVTLGFEHVPACAVPAVGFDDFLEAFPDFVFGHLWVADLGFLGDDDGVDDLLFGLLHELGVAFTAGDLQAGFGFGFDAGESLLDQVGVDEFAVNAEHGGG